MLQAWPGECPSLCLSLAARAGAPRDWGSALSQRFAAVWDSVMPSRHGAGAGGGPSRRSGWCGCLQSAEPPEITYCVVDQAGTLSLQALTPTQPMPEEEELNAKFAELVVSPHVTCSPFTRCM